MRYHPSLGYVTHYKRISRCFARRSVLVVSARMIARGCAQLRYRSVARILARDKDE